MFIQAQAHKREVDATSSEEVLSQRNINVNPPLPFSQSSFPVGARFGHFTNCRENKSQLMQWYFL